MTAVPSTDPAQCDWGCRSGTAINDGTIICPWPRPLAGDGCSDEGLQCTYDVPCRAQTSLGPSLVCQQGHWIEFGGIDFGCPPQIVGF